MGYIRKPQRNASIRISILECLHLHWIPLALEIWQRASGTSIFFVLLFQGGAGILRKSSNDCRWRFISRCGFLALRSKAFDITVSGLWRFVSFICVFLRKRLLSCFWLSGYYATSLRCATGWTFIGRWGCESALFSASTCFPLSLPLLIFVCFGFLSNVRGSAKRRKRLN